MPPVAVIGSLTRDIVDGGRPRVGGAPFYAATALRAAGTRGIVVARCAEEDRTALLRPLVAVGLPVVWRRSDRTAAFELRNDGDRRRVLIDTLPPPWTPAELPADLDGASWIHVGALVRGEFPASTLSVLARGRRVLLDGQGLVRASRKGALELERDADSDVLRHVTALKLDEEEAIALLGGTSAAELAALGVPEVIVTLGPRGSLVYADNTLASVPAHGITVDPTGAGDAFAAAYAASRSGGLAPAAAARRATAVVADVLRRRR